MKYYKFEPEKPGQCEVRLLASEAIYSEIEQEALQQLFNARQLPGVLGVIGLPDLHLGYGLPIGGVMVCDMDKGVISPGAVGFDINCGVRLLTSNLEVEQLAEKAGQLIQLMQQDLPAGVGSESHYNFSRQEFVKIVEQGLPYTVKNLNFGTIKDIKNCEASGYIAGADFSKVSAKAYDRGKTQLGTLGGGNHFVEIQKIDQVYDPQNEYIKDINPGHVTFMIHTGSRGFGHQIAQDYMDRAKNKIDSYSFELPSKNLASLPFSSKEGQNYFRAMACAANFAFSNRQLLTAQLRRTVQRIFPEARLNLLYDLTHNIAKKETHVIGGRPQQVLVHRKGATRLAPNGLALIPGSMGTGSFAVTSLNSEATLLSFESVAHGAGRTMGRREAKRTITDQQHSDSIRGIKVVSGSNSSLLDESPLAYKNIDTVIESLQKTELARPLLRLKPLAVLKG